MYWITAKVAYNSWDTHLKTCATDYFSCECCDCRCRSWSDQMCSSKVVQVWKRTCHLILPTLEHVLKCWPMHARRRLSTMVRCSCLVIPTVNRCNNVTHVHAHFFGVFSLDCRCAVDSDTVKGMVNDLQEFVYSCMHHRHGIPKCLGVDSRWISWIGCPFECVIWHQYFNCFSSKGLTCVRAQGDLISAHTDVWVLFDLCTHITTSTRAAL